MHADGNSGEVPYPESISGATHHSSVAAFS